MGIPIRSSSNVAIRDTAIRGCWGDGINIGYDSGSPVGVECRNVTIRNMTCDNRRQGFPVTACIGGIAENSVFINTIGRRRKAASTWSWR